jgi:hypothetical protein
MILLALQCFLFSFSATLGWWTGKQISLLIQATIATYLLGDRNG